MNPSSAFLGFALRGNAKKAGFSDPAGKVEQAARELKRKRGEANTANDAAATAPKRGKRK